MKRTSQPCYRRLRNLSNNWGGGEGGPSLALGADLALLQLVAGDLVRAHEVVIPDLDGDQPDFLVAIEELELHALHVLGGGQLLAQEGFGARLVGKHGE